jgi:hypothetical protein
MARVEVVDADEMDDKTFLKHLDKRHPEIKTERALHKNPHIAEAWVGPYRAFHEYQHRTGDNNHEHVWEDDDDE